MNYYYDKDFSNELKIFIYIYIDDIFKWIEDI